MSLLEQWHREHIERRRRLCGPPPPRPTPPAPPAPPAPKPKPTAEVIDLELHRLVRRAQNIEELLADFSCPAPKLPDIIRIVARFYEVTPEFLTSDIRTQKAVVPRQVAMYLMRHLTNRTLTDIGRAFNRDHSTAVHAVAGIDARRLTDPRLDDELVLLAMKIMERAQANSALLPRRQPPAIPTLSREQVEFLAVVERSGTLPPTPKNNEGRKITEFRQFCRRQGLCKFDRTQWDITDLGRIALDHARQRGIAG